jgi:hypothetical protein
MDEQPNILQIHASHAFNLYHHKNQIEVEPINHLAYGFTMWNISNTH